MRKALLLGTVWSLAATAASSCQQPPEQSGQPLVTPQTPERNARSTSQGGQGPEKPSGTGGGGMGGMMVGEGATEDGAAMVPGMMMGGEMGSEMMRDMRAIHGLLAQHDLIHREVEDIPGGVRTLTTSQAPEVAELIRTHVWQMKKRMEAGNPIRMMDPVFRELFEHHDKVHLQIEEVPGGARVTETSNDPEVVKLIRQHAHRAVSEFVERGRRRAMEPTPLPPDYEDSP